MVPDESDRGASWEELQSAGVSVKPDGRRPMVEELLLEVAALRNHLLYCMRREAGWGVGRR